LALTTTGDYLRSWGYSPQKPKKKAYEQNPKAVKRWLEQEYPAIVQKTKLENAEIHWGDETGVRNNCQHGRSYAPKGRTPTKKSMSKRLSLNMISTVTNQGKVEFMIYSDRMNSERFICFLVQLIKAKRRKIHLTRIIHQTPITKPNYLQSREMLKIFTPSRLKIGTTCPVHTGG